MSIKKIIITSILVLFSLVSIFAFTSYNDSLVIGGYVSSYNLSKIVYNQTTDFYTSTEVTDSVTITEDEDLVFSFLYLTNESNLNVTFDITATPLENENDSTATLDYKVSCISGDSWVVSSTEGQRTGFTFTSETLSSTSNAKTNATSFKVSLDSVPVDAKVGNYSGTITFEIVTN